MTTKIFLRSGVDK